MKPNANRPGPIVSHRPTRRQLLAAGVGGSAAMLLSAPGRRAGAQTASASADAETTTEQLAEDVYVLTTGPTNSIARADAGGLILVDGTSAAAAESLVGAIAELGAPGPVHTLFNTHWHTDHTGLNERLGTSGARIVAQENTRLWMKTDITWPWDESHFEPLAAAGQPNESFFDSGELDQDTSYGYLRHAAHTDGDLYVYFRSANVLAIGDAASNAGWPLVDWWTGGWIGGIVGTMELLLSLSNDDTRIVPARGPVMTRALIEEQYEMYNVIYSRLAEMLNRGRGPDEAVAARPTAEFDERMGGDADTFVRRAFESLWAYLSPDA